MILRHPKRWCDECKLMVFARGHGHRVVGPDVSYMTAAALMAAGAIKCGCGDPRLHARAAAEALRLNVLAITR